MVFMAAWVDSSLGGGCRLAERSRGENPSNAEVRAGAAFGDWGASGGCVRSQRERALACGTSANSELWMGARQSCRSCVASDSRLARRSGERTPEAKAKPGRITIHKIGQSLRGVISFSHYRPNVA